MKLTVHRIRFSEKSTQGYLDIDGATECYTLEPRKDQSQGKPFCIVAGLTFKVELKWSHHFDRIVPHILDVPNFEAIEIHPLNFPHQTEGCLGVGRDTHEDVLGHSDAAFEALMEKLKGQDDITITYLEETVESSSGTTKISQGAKP